MILGTDMNTGEVITDSKSSILQSIKTILTTPIGSRVLRRDFGSNIFYMLDQPMNQVTKVKIQAAVADALQKHERRVNFTSIRVSKVEKGHLTLDVEGYLIGDNQFLRLTNINI